MIEMCVDDARYGSMRLYQTYYELGHSRTLDIDKAKQPRA